jgi:uracil-DNA glycosylase
MNKSQLDQARIDAAHCRACPLWRNATQTVFGEGKAAARIMLVGEQPGDVEDIQGRPFVGPAGAVLDRALAQAGLERTNLYVTNAVKHFKWELRGKRRMHKTPAQKEIEACSQWLAREVQIIKPDLIICLGGTATRAVLGRTVKIGEMRGKILSRDDAPYLLITVHPSYILRIQSAERPAEYDRLVRDLALAAKHPSQREAVGAE